MRLFGFITISILANLGLAGCGTIVGNGNGCEVKSCDGETTRRNTDRKSEGGGQFPSPNQAETAETTQTPNAPSDNQESSSGTSAPAPENSKSSGPAWQKFPEALFNSCSTLFDLGLPKNLVLNSRVEFQGGLVELKINAQDKSGEASFKSDVFETQKYAADLATTCLNHQLSTSEKNGIKYQNNSWLEADGSTIEVIVQYKPSSPAVALEIVSISIRKEATQLVLYGPGH